MEAMMKANASLARFAWLAPRSWRGGFVGIAFSAHTTFTFGD